MRSILRPALVLSTLMALAACNDDDGPPIDQAAADRGAGLVRDCRACHNLDGRTNLVGPHLVDLYGRQVAAVRDFEYSEVLAAQDFAWDSDTLSSFILNPTETYPGTMMAYSGLSAQDADDITEYFRARARE